MNSAFTHLAKCCIVSFSICFCHFLEVRAQLCNGSGNVVVFSNYDGSGNTAATRLNIDVDVNIPNLKIGIASYERVTVNIAGSQVACVAAVRWAGYGASNNHCSSTAATVITGVAPGIITYVTSPPSTVTDPLGNGNIIGGYACTLPNGTGNGGGSASMYQIVNYFLSAFGPGSTLRSAFSQYGCWAGATKVISAPATGNCCPLIAAVLPVDLLSFTQTCSSDDQVNLEWTTAAEHDNAFFTLERSVDGIEFTTVAEMPGAGNSEELKQYRWSGEAHDQANYYRLSQTDGNGITSHFAAIRSQSCNRAAAGLSILSQPGEATLIVEYKSTEERGAVQLVISDSYGNELLVKDKEVGEGSNIFMLDVSTLAGGAYLLMAKNGGQSAYRRFLKF